MQKQLSKPRQAKDVTFLQSQKQKINPKNHRKFCGGRFDIKGREIERFKRTRRVERQNLNALMVVSGSVVDRSKGGEDANVDFPNSLVYGRS